MHRILALAFCLAAPTLALAAPPKSFTAQYEVLRNGEKLGKATMTFAALANGRFQFQTTTVGSEGLAALAGISINENSLLDWKGKQPEAISYDYQQKMAWKTRQRSLRVNASAGHIVNTDKNGSYTLAYQPGVLDRHAVTVVLMQDLTLGKTGDFLYTVPDRGTLSNQRYRQLPSEKISTALGSQPVIRVERIRESNDGRTTTIWFGQDKNFVPLRLLQKEPEGETIEMRIVSVR